MTRVVTPHVLAELSLGHAIGVTNKEVLDEMMEDATAEGDYAAAGQVRPLPLPLPLTHSGGRLRGGGGAGSRGDAYAYPYPCPYACPYP